MQTFDRLLGREFELGPTLVRAATAAARDDPRFDPMSVDDVERAVIDVSMLTAIEWLDPAGLPASIRLGCDGLVVEKGTSRGLLLPQVASENHFDAERFLEETCRKAALPRDAWKHGARVGRFQALVVS
ncbi:MAG: AmmeMemoRadiSam system protein A [Acidobacteria bacterium]|nr:AmmeMemoRadiSam system protein A [Acidobacteriota bacterium]